MTGRSARPAASTTGAGHDANPAHRTGRGHGAGAHEPPRTVLR
jgi:hypothetical protein